MDWFYRRGQRWRVAGMSIALLGGCGAPGMALPAGQSPAPLASSNMGTQSLAESTAAAWVPKSPVDGMPLLLGDNVAGMPIVQPAEHVAPMPGLNTGKPPAADLVENPATNR